MKVTGLYKELPLVVKKNDWLKDEFPGMNITYRKDLTINITYPDKNFSQNNFNYSKYFEPEDFKSKFSIVRKNYSINATTL
jgi:hypothetical protein